MVDLVWNPQSELLREPNLLIPGKKPTGPVKIDWSSSLLNNIDGIIYPGEGTPLYYKKSQTLVMDSNGTPAYNTHAKGKFITGNGTTTETASTWRMPYVAASSEYQSYYIVYIPTNTSDVNRSIVMSNDNATDTQASGTIRLGIGQDGADLDMYLRRAVRLTASGVLVAGTPVVAALTMIPTVTGRFYVNGDLIGTYQNNFSSASYFHCCGGNAGSGNGLLQLALIYKNEQHSNSEIEAISNALMDDPYQFLIPA